MSIESAADLAGMQRVGRVVALTIAEMRAAVRIGMTTAELDAVAASAFRRRGARSAPQLAYGFPGTTCISVNDEIVHGIPGPRRLLKIDVTAELGGYIADAATTILIPPTTSKVRRLRHTAVTALDSVLSVVRGQRVSVIGRAVESAARREGFAVVRELCGHGVGRKIHEPPQVPNHEDRFSRDLLTDGLVIAVEPMLIESPSSIVEDQDGWTIRTRNGCMAVHEEHTIVVTDGLPLILTAA